ncbi:MAG: IclR family transcriptional regulator C-terminal domain-containing protein [Chthoniobacterales bacterium]
MTRGLEILQNLAVCGSSLGLTQLAKNMELPKSTTHRLLNILRDLGLIEQHSRTLRYSASARLFALMYGWTHHFGPNALLHQVVRDSAAVYSATVYLCMLADRSTHVISAAGFLGDTAALGSTTPVYASSAGKILVANRPEPEWENYAPANTDLRLTEKTNLDPQCFYRELRIARKEGVAWNLAESADAIVSAAAPVQELLYEPRLAVALVISELDFTVQTRVKMARDVKAIAMKISRILRRQDDVA